jgi:hypothetical protein
MDSMSFRTRYSAFQPKGDEAIVRSRKLHNKKLHTLYSVSNIVRVIKSRTVSWAMHLERREINEKCIKPAGGET